jgi:hypothetical protein
VGRSEDEADSSVIASLSGGGRVAKIIAFL